MNALFHCNSSTSLSIQSLLSRANTVAKEWGGKLSSTDEITVNTVTPKCEELVRLHDLCTESLKYKQMLADKQSTLYVHIDTKYLCQPSNPVITQKRMSGGAPEFIDS